MNNFNLQWNPNPKFRQHPIFLLHKQRRDDYYKSDASNEEKRSVYLKELQIAALNDAHIEGANRINWFYDRMKTMTDTDDPKNYAAAVDGALFYSRIVWQRYLKTHEI